MLLYILRGVVALAGLIFIVGMIKPKWILFWMKRPDRLTVTMIAMLLFMGSWTGIAKLTLKPRDREHPPVESQRSLDDQNQLQLDNR
ncbi:hypothetical protein [Methylococcus sp. EFPC2]|uniref:hypothetical protein n=1 Tax=Methylococcus sp. EFPC2 TaxID=2812648 RepID=UPI001967F577|nr:hypothetical protein [Methylococcus sp. EFPC2]QSA95559.1 hypothetical protein JWZ97_09860 [Methylococcus sp. EFPC2]